MGMVVSLRDIHGRGVGNRQPAGGGERSFGVGAGAAPPRRRTGFHRALGRRPRRQTLGRDPLGGFPRRQLLARDAAG